MIRIGIACVALVIMFGSGNAQLRKPKLPSGLDPGGLTIILLTTGIDYTKPTIASRLARDGEGELIGWDTIDADNRPYAADGEGTTLALGLLRAAGVRIVPIRIDPNHAPSLIAALNFAARMPGRVVLLPQIPIDRVQRTQLITGFARFPDRFFIVPADIADAATQTADNVLTIGASQPGAAAPNADLQVSQDVPAPLMAVAEFLPALLSCEATAIAKLHTSTPKLRVLSNLLSGPASRSNPDVAAACRISAPSH